MKTVEGFEVEPQLVVVKLCEAKRLGRLKCYEVKQFFKIILRLRPTTISGGASEYKRLLN